MTKNLRSMTGFGRAMRQSQDLVVCVEIKTVNNRFLKFSLRTPSYFGAFDMELENTARSFLRRGHVNLTVNVQRESHAAHKINEEVVKNYQEVFKRLGLNEQSLPLMPGVCATSDLPTEAPDLEQALVRQVLEEALRNLTAMREREGAALRQVLQALCEQLDQHIAQIKKRAPHVVIEHQQKLSERISTLLAATGTPLEPQHLAREVAFFADRCDISEELERLSSHVAQIRKLLAGGEEAGRSLDFVAQELLREANTIGSKSSDIEITNCVLMMKAEIERFKEQVANVE